LPLPGITAAVVDETGQDVPNGQGGILVVKRPWPAMIRTIWGDPERFKKSYYPEELGGTLYLAGDGTVRDKETGYFTIMGRIDDVLNVSGHRLGTMENVFWCTADIGWVTGHTYITYGPLACGGTQVVFEGVPTYPDAGRFWKMIGDHKVTVFYTAPTAIRSLIKAAEADDKVHPKSYDLSSLRIIGTVGEPINPEAWMWYHKHVGHERCPIVDTWWQTETGGHMITPLPGATPTVPGSCTLPLPGITAAVVDETGQDVPNGQGGILVVKRPWPAMIRTIWGDPERFKKSYYPEELGGTLYLAGDGTVRDKETGYFTIMGRIDDVLNVSGHRLGTMEIESALVSHELVAEAAVVGRPDDTTGEAVVAFVVLKRSRPEGDEAAALAKTLRDWVGKQIGPIAKPKDIRFGDNLPKTRSGKIMRRLLRSLAKGEAITQDTSTLENPAILEQLTEVR
ncbi:AMP-binding protein, partial [Burkholderia cenocepacia]|uniref:AMP-binding protein n=1 Tax=Burkholderia cenocepacia TaxID=95486 RepID=UPI00285DDF52